MAIQAGSTDLMSSSLALKATGLPVRRSSVLNHKVLAREWSYAVGCYLLEGRRTLFAINPKTPGMFGILNTRCVQYLGWTLHGAKGQG